MLASYRLGDLRDHGLYHILNAFAGFSAAKNDAVRIQLQDIVDLINHPLRHGAGKVDFAHHRNNDKLAFFGQNKIGDGLGFHALRGVHKKKHAFHGRQTFRDLIRKIHMARSVNQIQDIVLIVNPDRAGFDGNAALSFQVHIVQHLISEFTLGNSAGMKEKTVRERGFAVVNMGDDAEIADFLGIHVKKRKVPGWLERGPLCRTRRFPRPEYRLLGKRPFWRFQR